jgi:hypothetical protein
MCLATARKTVVRKTKPCGPLAAVLLFTFSSLMSAQSSQPAVCNMDSDGFCVAGAIQPAPLLNPAPQNMLRVESSPAPQNKLQVEFRDNLLRIDAENATLRDTLKAVSARTGAEIEFPSGELQERIFAHLGPASARDVVSQLLNGVPFNFVILSSDSEPTGVTRLILSRSNVPRESAIPETPAMAANESATSQVYGAAFGVDSDLPASEPLASQVPAGGASPTASWVHTDGPKLSGEYLDQMQKAQIQQEQQQFAQQLQQQRQQQQQQQEQPSPSAPPQ